MDFFSVGLRVLAGLLIGVLVALFVALILQRRKYYRLRISTAVTANSGSEKSLPLYKSTEFFKMSNAGDDLCADDISFEFFDYCGSKERMYFNREVNNETGN